MNFLITAGPTREYIDPVRYMSNASSGKMGYALARAALRAGHSVTLVTGLTNLRKPAKVNMVEVVSSIEMFAAVKKCFECCDCLIMAAAVSDYTVEHKSDSKIKKNEQALTLELKPTTDILKWAGKKKGKKQILVGFALEDRSVRERAEKKLSEKNLDMIVANRPAAIGADRSSVEIKKVGHDWVEILNMRKTTIANKIIKMAATCKSANQ